MNVLECHGILAGWSTEQREQSLPGDFIIDLPGGRADVWPAAATAAVMLSTTLSTIDTEQDLRESLLHFQSLLSIDVRKEEEWKEETLAVVDELARWGWRASGELAAVAESN